MQIGAALDKEMPNHGAIIAPNLYAPIHQHFFCFRVDCALDGVQNSVYEVNFEADLEGGENPQCNGYYPSFRLLTNELDAVGQIDSKKHRFWKIV